jgi:hypothetical protein
MHIQLRDFLAAKRGPPATQRLSGRVASPPQSILFLLTLSPTPPYDASDVTSQSQPAGLYVFVTHRRRPLMSHRDSFAADLSRAADPATTALRYLHLAGAGGDTTGPPSSLRPHGSDPTGGQMAAATAQWSGTQLADIQDAALLTQIPFSLFMHFAARFRDTAAADQRRPYHSARGLTDRVGPGVRLWNTDELDRLQRAATAIGVELWRLLAFAEENAGGAGGGAGGGEMLEAAHEPHFGPETWELAAAGIQPAGGATSTETPALRGYLGDVSNLPPFIPASWSPGGKRAVGSYASSSVPSTEPRNTPGSTPESGLELAHTAPQRPTDVALSQTLDGFLSITSPGRAHANSQISSSPSDTNPNDGGFLDISSQLGFQQPAFDLTPFASPPSSQNPPSWTQPSNELAAYQGWDGHSGLLSWTTDSAQALLQPSPPRESHRSPGRRLDGGDLPPERDRVAGRPIGASGVKKNKGRARTRPEPSNVAPSQDLQKQTQSCVQCVVARKKVRMLSRVIWKNYD